MNRVGWGSNKVGDVTLRMSLIALPIPSVSFYRDWMARDGKQVSGFRLQVAVTHVENRRPVT